MQKNFNEIRSYSDYEVEKVLKRLSKEKMFNNLVLQFVPSLTLSQLQEKLSTIKSLFEFQIHILYPICQSILKKSSAGLTYDGLDNVKRDNAYLFISNHRDIILDPSLLNFILFENGYDTSQVAIGNNLLIFSWIRDMVRLAKSFVVKRNSVFSQRYDESKLLSSYIRHMLLDKKSSVWISQREGRTKDGDDKTQASVLKMIAMSTEKSFTDGFTEINIIPVSMSYEFDPCDILKAVEMYSRLLKRFYIKTAKDDLRSMLTGLLGQKGQIHFSFGKPINDALPSLNNLDNKTEQFRQLASVIDEQIYANYRLYPVNYVAYDVLNKTNKFINKYNQEDRDNFVEYVDRKLSKAKAKGNIDLIENFLIGIYANPVKNKYTSNASGK